MTEILPYVYLVCLHLAAPLTVVIAVIAWRHRHEWAVAALPPLLSIGVAWTACLLLGAYSPTAEWAHFWIYQVRIGVIVFAPAVTLIVVLEISGRRHLLRPLPMTLLFAVPLTTQIFLHTDANVFFMEPAEVRQVAGFWTLNRFTHGPWMGPYFVYLYGASILALILMVLEIARSPAEFRRRATILVIGLLVANLSAVPNMHGILPPPHFDWTVLGLFVQCVFWTAFLARNPATFDLMPIARDAVLDLIDDAILAIDHRGKIVDANRAARALLAHLPGQLVGRSLETLVARDGTALADRLQLPGAVGEVAFDSRVFEARSKRLQQGPGAREGTVVVLHEVTTHKQLIDDLDAFARAVAHDLRNPIGVIVGYAEMAADEPDASPLAKEAYATVVARAREMAERIDALLLLARVGGGDREELRSIDMTEAFRRALGDLSALIATSGARIGIVGELPRARGYAPWVVAVLTNYLSNAIKYGGTPPLVEVGGDFVDGAVRYWVRDNGAGMTAAQQAAIFREFARLGDEGVAGHGLGLSIVRRIVDRLGGQVGVSSTPGRGSTFWFTLPRADDGYSSGPLRRSPRS